MTDAAPETPLPTNDAPYAVWEETLTALTTSEGGILLLGGTDMGKTTFARLLVNRLTEAGQSVAVLDADLGQSEIGPPACVGLAFAECPALALSDLPPQALAFVGSSSPPGALLEHVAATRRLADLIGPRRLVVDTGGYIHGPNARRLHLTTFDLLSPAHVVGLQRANELEPFLAPIRRREGCRIHTPPIPAVISRKSPKFRAQRRAMRFAATFQDAKLTTYSLDDVALIGPWLGGGVPVAANLLKFLNLALAPHARVYYAEMCDRHLGLMVSHPVAPTFPGLGLAQQELRAQSVSLTVAPRLKHLLLGLEGGNGRLLGLGLLEALDFRRRTLGVLTPVRAPAAARILRFGLLRIAPDGTEVGSLKPGEF